MRLFLFCILLFFASFVHAVPGPITIDSRIKVYIHNPMEIFPITVHHGRSVHIDLRDKESVRDIILGDNSDWVISVKDSRIFIKSNGIGASTNMTVITNRDIYEFDLHSKSASNGFDLDMAYVVRFFYPPSYEDIRVVLSDSFDVENSSPKKSNEMVDLLSSNINYGYKTTGDMALAPIVTFTDGRLTYFKFKRRVLPIIVEFDKNREGKALDIIEYNGYVIVNSSASKFMLRLGKQKIAVEKE